MSYETDFRSPEGWSAVDVATKLDRPGARAFLGYLKANGVDVIIRYYASSRRPKTISQPEARILSQEGFAILPVYQDIHRAPEHFGRENGLRNAASALEFARYIGQPAGTSIVFAVDADFSEAETNAHILPFFREVRQSLGREYRVGAYGSGLVLKALMEADVIDVPWLSMSRSFRGTRDFFYSDKWALRQVPPDLTEEGVGYDRNVLNWSAAELGTFQIAEDGAAIAFAVDPMDAVLGGERFAGQTIERLRTTANAYVSTEGLNLRDAPNGAILKPLTIGQPVNDLGSADVEGWRRVDIEGRSGVVFGKYLRQPSAPEIESLLASTIAEWVRFKKGRASEANDPYCQYVGEMWRSIELNYDGRSRYSDGREVPWSAAFISFVVRRAGSSYAKFKFSDAHSVFVNDAIAARILDRRDRPFWGYRRAEAKPEIGDIIQRSRTGASISFDYAENHERYESHSDIVVEVTPNVVRVIGGNISDTVSMADNIQEYKLTDGFIAPEQKVIALLKNRAREVQLSGD